MIHNFDIAHFLTHYWQKKPLLIRAAFPDYQSPISAEELAGLACEDFVESRIISEHQSEPKWSLENGPFLESQFTKMPKSHWTLLIQGLNKLYPELDDLLHEFNFIPRWRVDDLMASYAAPHGSVGPHIDQYDVFLLQAKGRRQWKISEQALNENDFEQDIPLKIIKNFNQESEWILEAGDMLYLPPNVAHYGIGMEDCMTFSIGFRAPSHSELLAAFVDDHIHELNDDLRYRDPLLVKSLSSGEISTDAVNHIQEILLSQFNDKNKIADWFGRYITEYLHSDNEEHTVNTLSNDNFIMKFKNAGSLRRTPTVRANYLQSKDSAFALYVNGEKQDIKPEVENIAMIFCNTNSYHYNDLKNELSTSVIVEFLCELYNNGYIEI